MRCKDCGREITKLNKEYSEPIYDRCSIGYEYLKDKKDCNDCKKNGETVCGNDTKNMNCFEGKTGQLLGYN